MMRFICSAACVGAMIDCAYLATGIRASSWFGTDLIFMWWPTAVMFGAAAVRVALRGTE